MWAARHFAKFNQFFFLLFFNLSDSRQKVKRKCKSVANKPRKSFSCPNHFRSILLFPAENFAEMDVKFSPVSLSQKFSL